MMAPDDEDFFYEVQDSILATFANCSVAQRLAWLEEARTFSWAMTPPDAQARRRLARDRRRGLL